MASNLIDTKGGDTSNTYATVSGTDSYFDDMYGHGDWGNLTTDEKTQLLLQATKDIDALPARYTKKTYSQALRYPIGSSTVTDDTYDDGYTKAQEATMIQAYYILQNQENEREQLYNRAAGITSQSLKGASFSYSGYNKYSKYHPDVLRLLGKFIRLTPVLQRG